MMLAWGAKVSPAFRAKVEEVAQAVGTSASWLMAVMAFETGRTFSSRIVNATSRATGLIQFLPSTAAGLGTSVEDLRALEPEDQLEWVGRYLMPYRGRLEGLADLYMAVFYPKAIGEADGYVIATRGEKAYDWNKALDADGDGKITKAEAAAPVFRLLAEGMRAENAWTGEGEPAVAEEQPTEAPMAPIAVALIPTLVDLAAKYLPQVAAIFAQPGKASRERNVEVGAKILEAVSEGVGKVMPVANAQAAVEAIATNPAAREAAELELKARFFDLIKYQAEQDALTFERQEKSMGAAAERAKTDTVDLAPKLADNALRQLNWLLVGIAVLAAIAIATIPKDAQVLNLVVLPLITLFVTLAGKAADMAKQVFDYRFGSSAGSKNSGDTVRGAFERLTSK